MGAADAVVEPPHAQHLLYQVLVCFVAAAALAVAAAADDNDPCAAWQCPDRHRVH